MQEGSSAVKKQMLTDVLAVVAEELTDLTLIAETLDETLEALVPVPGDTEQVKAIQRVDMLHQHLRDLTAVVAWVARDESNGYEADMGGITHVVKLDYIRKRLLFDPSIAPLPETGSGRIEMF